MCNEDDGKRIFGLPEKFFYETVRSIIFGISAVIATILIFEPIKAKQSFETAKENLKIDYQRNQQRLTLQHQFFIQQKVFERRVEIIDNFIVKSDAYTKTAFNVFESWTPESIEKYKEESYNDYQLALARIKASFGPEIDELLNLARQRNKELFKIYKNSNKKNIDPSWREARKTLVGANKAITNRVTEIQFSKPNKPLQPTAKAPAE